MSSNNKLSITNRGPATHGMVRIIIIILTTPAISNSATINKGRVVKTINVKANQIRIIAIIESIIQGIIQINTMVNNQIVTTIITLIATPTTLVNLTTLIIIIIAINLPFVAILTITGKLTVII